MRVRLPPCPHMIQLSIFFVIGLFIFLGLFTVFVLFFVSRRLSPIPYFPSNHKDISLILKLLALKNNQILYDLGAGDGVVILRAAATPLSSTLTRRSNAKAVRFVAVEINPILIFVMKLRRLFHQNKANIEIIKADIFTMRLPCPPKYVPVFFMYISPWYMEKTILNILRQYKSFELVTYFYAAPKSKKYKVTQLKHATNIHDVYRYKISKSK